MKNITIINDFASVNGGTNNLKIARIVMGGEIVKSFTGKTANQRAERLLKKLSKPVECPVCSSNSSRPDYENFENMVSCLNCGSEFLRDTQEVTFDSSKL